MPVLFNTLVEPLPNVALNKQAVQASVGWNGVPSRAVDGCNSGMWNDGCCSHTLGQQNPWWRVDLLAVYKVTAVTIINRQDHCSSCLYGAQILVGNSLVQNGNQNPMCGIIPSFPGTLTYTFQCNEMEGRYINVLLPGSLQYLMLCEVQVFASLCQCCAKK
uniref:Fucolectin tachylectin-4 pentraxin-1 domain-containing protein n=1 Tax=Amphilophus citrinellus TaxID=61819 RepID=A0A3Q0QSA1_AMPCI